MIKVACGKVQRNLQLLRATKSQTSFYNNKNIVAHGVIYGKEVIHVNRITGEVSEAFEENLYNIMCTKSSCISKQRPLVN